ncbi:hypothetical protein C5167_038107 [Papaver somniferum]|uniref:ABC-2 type transporter transmembrane domain-containing protein n=1 Tax=Papaver somniferum TaxID=3469 RepID=A0A4Y7I883_PAPSO|nr:hypothetical protein C5167_038107 [Papaver somniferum]
MPQTLRLAGRKTGGYIEVSITITGYAKKQETFSRISGYCEQNDIHSPNLTVYESLLYSAWLCIPSSVDIDTREMFDQTKACLWKQHWSYWRNPEYNAIRFFFTVICALLFGSIFWQMGGKIMKQQDFLNVMGSMFTAVTFLGVNSASSVQPVVGIERSVFYRERAAGLYFALPYALAQVNHPRALKRKSRTTIYQSHSCC